MSRRATVLRERWQAKREAGSLTCSATDFDVPTHHARQPFAQRKAKTASRLRLSSPFQALKGNECALDLFRRKSRAAVGHIEEDRVNAVTCGQLDRFVAVLQRITNLTVS